MTKKKKKDKLNIGHPVRISKYRITFAKEYTPKWANKIYTVHPVQVTIRPVNYLLKDHTDKVFGGGFYEEELNKSKSRGRRVSSSKNCVS